MLKILFITAHPYLPQMQGGLQSSANQLCRDLVERGHKVAVLGALISGDLIGWMARIKMQINKRLFGCKVSRDIRLGYPVWRTWFPWEAVEYVANREKANLIVVMAVKPVLMALAARPTEIPVLLMLQDVEFSQHAARFEHLGDIPCIANSRFTAEKYRSKYGVDPIVIYPFMSLEKYKTEPTRENVTFINPVPEKGRDIAVQIARLCPDIPFSFVEAWPLSNEQRRELIQNLSGLSNVTLSPPQKDMRRVYGKSKILLAPSVWEEAYGMVVTEAQISGIPAIASRRGGLPEAVGPGGLLLDPEGPIEDWVQAVRKLWQDERAYADLSAAALAYAQRPEMQSDFQADAYEQALLKAAGKQKIAKRA